MRIGRFQISLISLCIAAAGILVTPLKAAPTESTDTWIKAASYSTATADTDHALYELGRAQSQSINHQQAELLQSLDDTICSSVTTSQQESVDEKAVLDPLTSALTLNGAAQENALKQALEAAQKNDLMELHAYAAGWLGRIYLRENKLNEAKDVLSKVSSDTVFTLPAGVALAEAQYKLGHPEKALAIWISLTKRYPGETDSIAAAVYAANTFATLGDESQAINYFHLARTSSQTALQNTQKLLQSSDWLQQLEQHPQQLGDDNTRNQLYDFYARNTGHNLLQALQTTSSMHNCTEAENKRLTVLKPELEKQQKEWAKEIQTLKQQYAELEEKIKAQKKKINSMQEVFQTLRTEEVLPQAKIESFGEQVARVKAADKRRDPVNNTVDIQNKKAWDVTSYQLSVQSRERQSVNAAQKDLVEFTHQWLDISQRITELEEKSRQLPSKLAAIEQKIAQLNSQLQQQNSVARNQLIAAAQHYLNLKQTQLKTILAEAQMGELSLVDKAVKAQ